MNFTGFTDADFDVFKVPGLEERMEALKANLRIKLQQLGMDFEDRLTDLCGRQMFAHVAKHARRTVNPPNDSWVAFCSDRRGYKKHPHFQIGAWETHAFALFGLIYESPVRAQYANRLEEHAEEVLQRVPMNYVWVPNHMDPNALKSQDVDKDKLHELTKKLKTGRQGELLVGITVPRDEAVRMSPAEFVKNVEDCFTTLLPFYEMAETEEIGVELS